MRFSLRLGAAAGLIAVIVAALSLPLASAQTSVGDQDVPGGHFYTQTNGNAGPQWGYRITDEAGIGFWSEFNRLGGVNALGYPVSRRFMLDGFIVQATQKVILQWRPDVNPPQTYFVNVFDKLHDQGKDAVLQQQFGIPPQLDPSFDAGKTPDQIQAARLALLNGDPAIAARYGSGPSAILYNGLPTSQITNAGPFSIIRAQRLAIQKWNTAGPGGITPGTVSVVNGGDVAKTLGLVPADAIGLENAAGQLQAPAAPPTPVATPTPAFTFKSKQVTDPPVDCNGDPNLSSIPCGYSFPNAGAQYIKGRVMDQKGNHLLFINVQANVAGTSQVVQTAGDGTFTFLIAGGMSPTGNCPPYALDYQIFVLSPTGAPDSDTVNVHYDGNCNTAGEFHFDFVKVR
jgi:hypothetical protein